MDAFTKQFLTDRSPRAVDIDVVALELGDQMAVAGARLIGVTFDPRTRDITMDL